MSDVLAKRPSLRSSTLKSALDMRDRVGILSAYSGAPPAGLCSSGTSQPSLDDQIEQIRKSVAGQSVGHTNAAIRDRLLDLKPTLELMGESVVAGHGRVLFCGIDSGSMLTATASTCFTPLATVRHKAFVLPLLCALERSCLTGVVVFDEHGIKAFESQDGVVEEVAAFEDEYGHPLSLSEAAAAVHNLARTRSWREVTLRGPGGTTDVFNRLLQEQSTARVLVDEEVSVEPDAFEMAQRASRLVAADRIRYQEALVSFLLKELAKAGQVVAGLSETRKAVSARRARTLVLDRGSCDGVGWRFNEGLERMVEMALSDGVRVVALGSETAHRISRHEGVMVRLAAPRTPN